MLGVVPTAQSEHSWALILRLQIPGCCTFTAFLPYALRFSAVFPGALHLGPCPVLFWHAIELTPTHANTPCAVAFPYPATHPGADTCGRQGDCRCQRGAQHRQAADVCVSEGRSAGNECYRGPDRRSGGGERDYRHGRAVCCLRNVASFCNQRWEFAVHLVFLLSGGLVSREGTC